MHTTEVLQKNATSKSIVVFIQDATTGLGKTGLAYNTASLTAYYARAGAASAAITLATQTVTGAYSSGGFVEIDGTNMPGRYRLDVPDAVLATGVDQASIQFNLSGIFHGGVDVKLTDYDPIAADPNVPAIKAKTDSLTFTVSGLVDGNVVDWKGSAAPANTGDAYARLGAPAGASVSADIAGVLAKTPDATHYTNARGDNLANLDAAVSGVPAAVQTSAATTPLPANVKKINSVTINGAGVNGNPFQP